MPIKEKDQNQQQSNSDVNLVLLPGLDGTGALFGNFIQQFPDTLAITVIDYPMDRHIAFEQLEDYVIPLLPVGRPLIILGESFSGPVALSLAARGDLDVAGVILVATFAKYPASLLKSFSNFMPLSLLFRLPIPDFIIRHYCFGKWGNKTLHKQLRDSVRANKPGVLSKRAREGASVDVTALLAKVNVPCLYVAASDDNMVPTAAIEYLKEHLAQLQVITIEGKHFILQCQPEKCFEAVKLFMEDSKKW